MTTYSIFVKRQYKKRMTRLRPTCTCCCVRSITFNAVTNGANTHTHARTHEHTHKSKSVQRNDENKILWDFNIQTNKAIEVRSPNIVCVNK